MQECAKICVKKCKSAKNWRINFADVCIFFFFDGSHICRFLPILRPLTVPRSHFRYPKTKAFTLIISYLYLQIVTSASESISCVGKWIQREKIIFKGIIVHCTSSLFTE